ncbi:MAG: VOC family protein [Actinomycetota bacterium]|nr:VOC family protein [Actinomycetota bacterium]
MERVLGVGGVFIRGRDKESLAQWYRDNLGIDLHDEWLGSMFPLRHPDDAAGAYGIWSVYGEDATRHGSPAPQYVLAFRVRNLAAMLAQLRANGCEVSEKEEHSAYGDFGWVRDCEGNPVELWQAPNDLPSDWR